MIVVMVSSSWSTTSVGRGRPVGHRQPLPNPSAAMPTSWPTTTWAGPPRDVGTVADTGPDLRLPSVEGVGRGDEHDGRGAAGTRDRRGPPDRGPAAGRRRGRGVGGPGLR